MKKSNFQNQGQSLIGIIIVLVAVGLISGGFYYYLSKQIPEIPEITKKPAEEVIKPEEVTPPAEELPKEEISPKEKIEEKPTEVPKEEKPGVACQDECSQTGLKRCSGVGYQICGNYDADSCLEWSSVTNCPQNAICQNGICISQKCTDGTLYGQCSTNKPKYCDNGILIEKCSVCGCSSNQACQTDSSCKTITQQMLLLLVEDALYEGLAQELNTYSNDVKKELGLETIIKTFPSSATVFEVKSYIKQIYDSGKLNGVLLIGNLPSGKFYISPSVFPEPALNDFIYQDIYDSCEYSKEKGLFGFEGISSSCEQNRIQPFWISRLTPNSSSKSSLSLLKDYFSRNHEFRTGGYSYKQKFLVYTPINLDEVDPRAREDLNLEYEKYLSFFDIYSENARYLVDIEKENSDQVYLNELRKSYEYENLFYNGHGAPTFHQKNLTSTSIFGTNFFLADFRSCSVGRFTAKDYIVGQYLFEGKGLVAIAPSVPVLSVPGADPGKEMHYLLSVGEPLYEALKLRGLGGANLFGDPTLRMRYYVKKPSSHRSEDPIINLDRTYLYFTSNQPKIDLKAKNSGESTLKISIVFEYYKFKEEWVEGLPRAVTGAGRDENYFYYLVNPNSEATFTFGFPFDSAPAENYKGEIFFLSNDPVNPYTSIPFEAVVK